MASLTLRRPTSLLVTSGMALTLLVGAALVATSDGLQPRFTLTVATLAVVGAVYMLPYIEPAIPLSLGICLSVFSGNWPEMGVPVGLDRPVVLYGIAGVILRTLPDAVDRRRIPIRGVHWLLLAVATYAIGSAIFAATITDSDAIFGILDRLGLTGFLLLVVAPVAFASEWSRDILLGALVLLGLYLSLTAVFETLGINQLIFPRYIADPSVGINYGRARGPFVEAGGNGIALYTCAVAAFMAAIRASANPRVRAFCFAVALLCGAGAIMTVTRQIWLGAALGTIVTFVCVPSLRRWLAPMLAGGMVLVLAVLAFTPGLQEQASDRAGNQLPVWDRLNSDLAALRMIEAKPLLGFGWYRFGADSPPYYRQADRYPLLAVGRPHNVFLANASELGLIGALGWLSALFIAVGSALMTPARGDLKLWRFGLIAFAVNWLVVANFTPLGYAFANHMLWLWPGIVWAAWSSRGVVDDVAPAWPSDAPARPAVAVPA
jgi:putative inorganic carbon (hco3(-)) transporter